MKVSIIRLLFKYRVLDNTIKGLIFWSVSIKSIENQSKLSATLGTQLWKGAAPILIMIANSILSWVKISNELDFIKRILISNPADAKVCVRKYLIAASLSRLAFLFKSKGIKAIVLNSMATQQISQEEEDIIIATLMITHSIQSNKLGEKNIRILLVLKIKFS